MAPAVIDLTSSPEPDESPKATAKSALKSFLPRKHSLKQKDGASEEVDKRPIRTAHGALQDFQPSKERATAAANGDNAIRSVRPQGQPVRSTGHPRVGLGNRNGYVRAEEHARPILMPAATNTSSHESLASILQRQAQSYATQADPTDTIGTFHSNGARPSGTPQSTNAVRLANRQLLPNPIQGLRTSPPLPRQPSKSSTPVIRKPIAVVDLDEEDAVSAMDAARPFKRQRTESHSEQRAFRTPIVHGNRSSLPWQNLGNAISPTSGRHSASEPLNFVHPIDSLLKQNVEITTEMRSSPESPKTSALQPIALKGTNISPKIRESHVEQKLVPQLGTGSSLEGFDHHASVPDQAQSRSSQVARQDQDGVGEGDSSTEDEHSSESGQETSRSTSDKTIPLASPTVKSPVDVIETTPGQQRTTSNHGVQYTSEEDDLLVKLKEVDKLNWSEIVPHFSGRTFGSLQVRYSTKLKGRSSLANKALDTPFARRPLVALAQAHDRSDSSDSQPADRPRRKKRSHEVSTVNGFISWADVKKKRLIEMSEPSHLSDTGVKSHRDGAPQFSHERLHPKSLSRVLRQRELGSNSGRSCTSTKSVPDEMKERVLNTLGPTTYYQGTSGDVTCVAWAKDGRHFAAGSIAITDERSMQYNKPCNLLLGDRERRMLRELPEHHLPRPEISNASNVNGLHSMRETQDPRLFMTVANVQFGPSGDVLYSAGSDCKVRAYDVSKGIELASCLYEIKHSAVLDLISISNDDVLATACHQSRDGSISVYKGQDLKLSLSPSRSDEQTSRAIFPSSLKWGSARHYSNLLLAGFSIDSIDEERDIAGETCLWDVRAQARIELNAVTRNVFDVAWNPYPTSTSTIFAVASTPGNNKVNKRTRSVVQCFSPSQNRAKRVFEWECPAFDINDIVYCEHDDNILAAGATDGKVYVWDQRYVHDSQGPLHVLKHGNSKNVLDHDRHREIADTGVRFVSWGSTSSRLYTGSSDGVVKVWNPYRSSDNTHVKDVATFTSAVMSGAFSPDKRDLLIGEDQGRINLLSVGYEHKSVRAMRRFEFQSVPPLVARRDPYKAAHGLLRSGQIELRPMGALPIRQAVQGPNYRGPYFEPTIADMSRAKDDYQTALNEQSDIHLRAADPSSQLSETEQPIRDADKKVEEAQALLQRMHIRYEDALTLKPQAQANQAGFCRAQKAQLQLETALDRPVENCKLDCNFLPAPADEDGDVPDSLRSEFRIPGALRDLGARDTFDLTTEEQSEAGLTFKCISCTGPAKKPQRGQNWSVCETCRNLRSGLTTSCEICSAPIRPSAERAVSNVCERCNFACFRCGGPAQVSKEVSRVACRDCELVWAAGVLGYELVRRGKARGKGHAAFEVENMQELIEQDDLSAFGEEERERYASMWQTR